MTAWLVYGLEVLAFLGVTATSAFGRALPPDVSHPFVAPAPALAAGLPSLIAVGVAAVADRYRRRRRGKNTGQGATETVT